MIIWKNSEPSLASPSKNVPKIKALLKVTCILLLACGMFSCNDDNQGPSTSKQFSFIVPAGTLNPDYSYWAIVSDENGSLLDTARLEENETYMFTAPETFKETYVTFTIFTYKRANEQTGLGERRALQTYVDIPFGTYGYKEVSPGSTTPQPVVKGKATLAVDGLLDVDWGTGVFLSGQNINARFIYKPTTTFDMDLLADTSPFLLTCKQAGALYYIRDNINVGEEIQKTVQDLQPADLKDVQVPDADKVSVNISGATNNGLALYMMGNVNVKQRTIAQLPYVAGYFKSYYTDITTQTGLVIQNYKTTGTDLPSFMKFIAGDLNYSVNGNVINADLPAACDMIMYAFSTDLSKDEWIIYTPPGKHTTNVPAMPKALVDEYGILSFEDLYKNGWYGIGAFEYGGYAGYEGFLSSLLGTKSPAPGDLVTKQIVSQKGPGGGRLSFEPSDHYFGPRPK